MWFLNINFLKKCNHVSSSFWSIENVTRFLGHVYITCLFRQHYEIKCCTPIPVSILCTYIGNVIKFLVHMFFSWDFSKKCNSIFCVHVPFSSDFVWYTKCNSGQYQQHAYISLCKISNIVTLNSYQVFLNFKDPV